MTSSALFLAYAALSVGALLGFVVGVIVGWFEAKNGG